MQSCAISWNFCFNSRNNNNKLIYSLFFNKNFVKLHNLDLFRVHGNHATREELKKHKVLAISKQLVIDNLNWKCNFFPDQTLLTWLTKIFQLSNRKTVIFFDTLLSSPRLEMAKVRIYISHVKNALERTWLNCAMV